MKIILAKLEVVGLGKVSVPITLEDDEPIPTIEQLEILAIDTILSIKENDCELISCTEIKEN